MDLNRYVGKSEPDNLITDLYPEAKVVAVKLRKQEAETTLKRGTLLERSSIDGKMVVLGTTEAAAIEAAAATYAITEDSAIVAGKTYYTKAGDVYTAVAEPDVGDIATYYEMTAEAVQAADAEVLTPAYVLAEDTVVGTAEDAVAVAYRSGCFSPDHVIVTEGYTLTDADVDALRTRDIVFKDFMS